MEMCPGQTDMSWMCYVFCCISKTLLQYLCLVLVATPLSQPTRHSSSGNKLAFQVQRTSEKKTEHRISVLSLFGWLYLVVAGLSTGYVVMDCVKKVHVRFVHKSLGLSITCWPGDVCLVGKVDFRCSVEWDCSI